MRLISVPRTMKQPCMIRGTARRDVIVGTRLGDLILGSGGNDLISSYATASLISLTVAPAWTP